MYWIFSPDGKRPMLRLHRHVVTQISSPLQIILTQIQSSHAGWWRHLPRSWSWAHCWSISISLQPGIVRVHLSVVTFNQKSQGHLSQRTVRLVYVQGTVLVSVRFLFRLDGERDSPSTSSYSTGVWKPMSSSDWRLSASLSLIIPSRFVT